MYRLRQRSSRLDSLRRVRRRNDLPVREHAQLAKKDKVIYPYMSLKYGLRSLLHWVVPFASKNMRMRYETTIVTFAFHLCLDSGSDTSHRSRGDVFVRMGAEVGDHLRAGCGLVDRHRHPCGRLLPGAALDAPGSQVCHICIGLSATRSCGSSVCHGLHGSPVSGSTTRPWSSIHMISGAVMLMAIPFTRLSHMLFFPFTRAYMGSEFGAVRHARDW